MSRFERRRLARLPLSLPGCFVHGIVDRNGNAYGRVEWVAPTERIRQIAQAKGLSLQWHFVDAPQEVRHARVADRNTIKGETFVREVPPEMFELLEQLYEAPEPAELEGAVLGVTD